MTTKTNTPLSEARDADARNTVVALQRAAKRARELAAQTATPLVVVHRGQPTRPKQTSKT